MVSYSFITEIQMIIYNNEIETKQMEWPRTVGHRPFDLRHGVQIVKDKARESVIEPVVPMYLRPSYVETNNQGK